MSGRKGSSNKITLGMLKGKSITTSVPTFAIRFHAEDEELESIYPSAEDTDEEAEKQEDESSSSAGVTSTIHSRDPSPMKEYLKGFGKRSTSVDAGMIDGTGPPSGSDTWRIFHEIKGKIAKTVEEKFGEIKTDRRSSSSVFSGSANVRTGRLVAGGSKDDSSINSDSEDISESSGKGPGGKKKEKKEDSSPKKSIETPKSAKGKEAAGSSRLDAPSTSGAQETSGHSAPTTPTKSKKIDSSPKHKSTIVDNSKTEASEVIDEIPLDEEVESGVEADEEMIFSTEPEDETIPTIDYRKPFPVITPPLKHKIRRKKSLLQRLYWWGGKLLPFIGILVYYIFPLPPYLSGLFSGIGLTLGISAIYTFIKRLTSPGSNVPEEPLLMNDITEFSIPDYASLPILEVPAVKEHHHINKYQGWMNEYRHDYDPETYSLNDTNSVYVRLEGTTLRISHTKLRIPKRAMWNERSHKLKFFHQRIYSIENCKLLLLPDGLARRRLWSKKYPICIVLACHSKLGFENFPEVDKLNKSKVPESLSECQDAEKDGSPTPDDASIIEESDDETFCHIEKPEAMETCLYLFARTDREKEDWYRRFAAAMRHNRFPQEEDYITNHSEGSNEITPKEEKDNLIENLPLQSANLGPALSELLYAFPVNDYMNVKTFESRDYDYLRFMARFQQVQKYKMSKKFERRMCDSFKHSHSAAQLTPAQKKKQEKMEADIEGEVDKEVEADVMWVNALVGRVLFDLLKNPEMLEKIKERLQRKMSAIRLPYFIEALVITELDLGHNTPLAHRASRPKLDERGLWIDLDITYDGTACFTLVTKLNLMKIKQMGEMTAAVSQEETSQGDKSKSPMYDSELDDTAESSDDDDALEDDGKSTSGDEKSGSTGSTGKKIISVVNKIAASKYFQQATEYKYIKKAMERVSKTNLVLTVEVNGLVGTLAVNIPPPPSDRLWYGFRGNPRLWLQARPKVGECQVSASQVTSWIEKQLCKEFQKKFVLPNMDDLVIPPMTADLPEC